MRIDADARAAIAARLLAARQGRYDLPAPDGNLPDDDDIRDIQDRIVAGMGARGGWKTGPAAPGAPITAGPIPRAAIHDARSPGVVDVGGPVEIELEVAFQFGGGFATGDAPDDAAVLAALQSAHVALELCRSRFAGRERVPLPWRQADCVVNEGLALGPEIAVPFALDLAALRASVAVNGVVRAERTGGLPVTDLRPVLGALVRHCCALRGGFAPGMVVTTGSWTGMTPAAPGDRVEGRFEGLGTITLELA